MSAHPVPLGCGSSPPVRKSPRRLDTHTRLAACSAGTVDAYHAPACSCRRSCDSISAYQRSLPGDERAKESGNDTWTAVRHTILRLGLAAVLTAPLSAATNRHTWPHSANFFIGIPAPARSLPAEPRRRVRRRGWMGAPDRRTAERPSLHFHRAGRVPVGGLDLRGHVPPVCARATRHPVHRLRRGRAGSHDVDGAEKQRQLPHPSGTGRV